MMSAPSLMPGCQTAGWVETDPFPGHQDHLTLTPQKKNLSGVDEVQIVQHKVAGHCSAEKAHHGGSGLRNLRDIRK